MKLGDVFLTASANMFRSKLRTTLTILAIFIGAFTLTLTNGIGSGISSYVDKQVSTLGQKDVLAITAKSTQTSGSDAPQKYVAGESSGAATPRSGGSTGILTAKDITALKADSDLTNVQPAYSVNPDYVEGSNSQKFKLTSSQIGGGATLDLASGSQLDNSTTTNQIILPLNYISILGYKNSDDATGKVVTIAISDAFGQQHTLQATVAGVQQPGLVSSSGAAFNQALRNNAYDLQTTGLPAAAKNKYAEASAHIVGDLSDSHVQQIKDKLDKMGYTAQTAEDLLGTFKSVISAITWVLDGFAIIALLAASFGIVNTLLMSVQERTKEIGLMKAMGMRSSRIFLLFSTEAVLIGFWGSAIGVGVAVLLGQVVNHVVSNGILKDLPGFNLLAFSVPASLTVIGLIMIIALLAGTLPARKAAKQNPIDALRYE
jgi:putative ABC transport system permease protein